MRRVLNILVFAIVALVVAIFSLQLYFKNYAAPFVTAQTSDLTVAHTGIVLGASVRPDKSLSPILQDRVDAALEAYRAGKIKRFLLSGDHGTASYDEVNAMKDYLNKKGVSDEVIFLDHAGFDTYDSMWRARKVFEVESAIVFTQEFHLSRAVYLARKMGINAQGLIADQRTYSSNSALVRRELLANVKAFTEMNIDKMPTYDGTPIPITGDSSLSHDK
ncbi:MAG: ElyC/SanA/YdcF family protein [Nonlabens sp.]